MTPGMFSLALLLAALVCSTAAIRARKQSRRMAVLACAAGATVLLGLGYVAYQSQPVRETTWWVYGLAAVVMPVIAAAAAEVTRRMPGWVQLLLGSILSYISAYLAFGIGLLG